MSVITTSALTLLAYVVIQLIHKVSGQIRDPKDFWSQVDTLPYRDHRLGDNGNMRLISYLSGSFDELGDRNPSV